MHAAGSPPVARILFVEDEDSISEPFSNALRRAGFEATIARTAAAALELADSVDPDLILLDLNLPDGDGRDVARTVRSRGDVPIIMLTASGAEADRVIGLELGADDYVTKPFSSAEVISRIRAVLRRSGPRTDIAAVPGSGEATIGALRVDFAARVVSLGGEPLELPRKEYDLLALLAGSAGRTVPREEIMNAAWDESWFGSTKTLDVHVSSLRRKLGDDPVAPTYVHTVRGVGFRFATADQLQAEEAGVGSAGTADGEPSADRTSATESGSGEAAGPGSRDRPDG